MADSKTPIDLKINDQYWLDWAYSQVNGSLEQLEKEIKAFHTYVDSLSAGYTAIALGEVFLLQSSVWWMHAIILTLPVAFFQFSKWWVINNSGSELTRINYRSPMQIKKTYEEVMGQRVEQLASARKWALWGAVFMVMGLFANALYPKYETIQKARQQAQQEALMKAEAEKAATIRLEADIKKEGSGNQLRINGQFKGSEEVQLIHTYQMATPNTKDSVWSQSYKLDTTGYFMHTYSLSPKIKSVEVQARFKKGEALHARIIELEAPKSNK